ncbi:MAG TPA: N-acetyltransferase [Planctomycetaceae bacterium]|nr:N-acetyltransferase [Planctomycetaceae bacterium]
MPEISIIQPRTFFERRRFLALPWTLNQKDPLWIPPLWLEQQSLVNYSKSAFYERNEIRTFLAMRSGKPVGRVAAILNRGHLDKYDDGVGFFGFFECVDDAEVSHALFETASEWLREKGCRTIRGPVNPSLNQTLGLLIEGFDTSPFFMMTYNPPYYEKLCEEFGLRKTQDLYAYWGKIDMLPKIRERWLSVCENIAERTGATTRTLDTKHFTRDVEIFLDIYNRALTNTWGFVPMSEAEVKETAFFLKFLIVPELAVAVEVDGKVVGATFGMPDYNPRIKAINGSLFPFGWARLLWKKHLIKKIRLLSTNVIPEYQMTGLGLVMLNAFVPKAVEWGIEEAEFSWVLESNTFSKGSLEKGGAIRTKTYRLYDKTITGAGAIEGTVPGTIAAD